MRIGNDSGGLSEYQAALDDLIQRANSATRSATKDAATLISRRTHSRLSRYFHAPGTPTPSPVGEPPARINGHLRDSLRIKGPRPTAGGFTAQIGPTTVYARIQELGGQAGRNHSVTIPPRPYLEPTTRDSHDDIRHLYVEALSRAM